MPFERLNIKRIKKKRDERGETGPLFTVVDNDVKINRDIQGQWKGFYFSQLFEDWEGRKLLKWVSSKRGSLPDDVVDVADGLLDSD